MDATLRFRQILASRLLHIAAAAAAAAAPPLAAGCGGNVVVDSEGAGGAGGASSGDSTISATAADSSVSSGPTSSTTVTTGTGTTSFECFLWTADDSCPDAGEALPWLQQDDCTASDTYTEQVVGGPYPQGGYCCYDTITSYCAVPGRPFVVEGRARAAGARRPGGEARAHARGRVEERAGWSAGERAPGVEGLSPAQREALADAWARDGLLEHASVASFGRFALDLLGAGAPADLVEAAHRAALDEVRHARLCLALASAYRGAPVEPAPFPFGGAVAVGGGLAALAAATAREGCVGEAVAAVLAAEQLARAEDPAVRAALAVIAEDEARHAELAFRAVAWAVAEGGEAARAAVAAVIEEAAARPMEVEGAAGDPGGALAAHGRLPAAEARAAAARALAEVALPCLRALVAAA